MAQKSAIASKSGNIAAQIDAQMQQKKNLLIEKTRIEKLFKDGAATSKQVDDINGSIDLIDKQINTIRTQNTSVADELLAYDKQIAQMEENIRRCHIIAPAAGTLLEKYALPNELLIPGKAVYKFANLEEIYLRAYISGSQLPLIKTGQKVEVLVDGADGAIQTHQGEIVWISSSAEFTPKIIQTREERVNLVYAIKVKVKNDGTLKIGMPGEVNFTTTDAR
jgi:HlyD family secretion protein